MKTVSIEEAFRITVELMRQLQVENEELLALVRRINPHLVKPELLGDLCDDAEKLLEKLGK